MFALPEYFEEPEWFVTLRLAAETLIAFLGLVGNLGVVIAITRCPFMHTVTNMFIRNLAIADIGVLVLSFPFAVVKEQTLYNWPLGRSTCQVIYPLSEIFIGVSVWSMVIIAIDRYRGIVNDRHLKSAKKAILICCIPWLASFLVISLPLLIVTRYFEGFGIKDCIQNWPQDSYEIMNQGYTTVASLFNYVLPLGIILWTYCKIFQKINQSNTFNQNNLNGKRLRSESSSRFEMRRLRRNNRARKILTPVVVVFAVTLLPVNVFRLALVFIPRLVNFRYLWIIYNFCIVSTVLNSSCNPFVYAIVSDNFRAAFKSMFKAKRNFSRERRSSSTVVFSSGTFQGFRKLKYVFTLKKDSTRNDVAVPSVSSTSSSGPV